MLLFSNGKLKFGFSHLCTLFSLLKLLLSFAEFSEVQSSDFFSLLNLLLISLDLLLKLGGELRHAILVLLVFINLEGKFLAAAFRLLVSLCIFTSMSLNISKLYFKLSDSCFKFCHGCTSIPHGILIGFSKLILKFTKLRLHGSFCL